MSPPPADPAEALNASAAAANASSSADSVDLRPFSVATSETTSTTLLTAIQIQCSDVAWEHVQMHLLVALVPWLLLTAVGLLVTTKAPSWAAGSRVNLQRYQCGLASNGIGNALAVLAVHLTQCVIFGIRASTGVVDPIYFALETIGGLYIIIDVLALWAYTISTGRGPVVLSAFTGPLALDMIVATSMISIAVGGPGVGLTWFSFNFLAALRMIRVVRWLQRAGASLGQWRRQAFFHVLTLALFVYASAASLMTLEILDEPRAGGSEEDPAWDLLPTMVSMTTMMFTLGSSTLIPKTVLGRLFAMAFTTWGCYHMASRVMPIARDVLFEKSYGLSSYKPNGNSRHVVILGTPTGTTLWEFMLETFHPNHFESVMEFEREAPNVVILLPEERTLAHMRKLLERMEALFFRDRVVLLYGDAFSPEDLARAAVATSERVVILPDLGVADVFSDDSANIMRTFALSSEVPHVPITCLLHSAEHNQSALASGGQSTFVSIDAFKLSLLALACLTRGALTLICNLCKTVGDMKAGGKHWELDYARSIDYELYELPLSYAYHGHTFAAAHWDALARSDSASVYLIGVTELEGAGQQKRVVKIHPGADYIIKVPERKTRGVFIATDVGAIEQCPLGEELIEQEDASSESSSALTDAGLFESRRMSTFGPTEEYVPTMRRGEEPRKRSKKYHVPKPETEKDNDDDTNSASTAASATAFPPQVVYLTTAEKEERLAMSKYENSINAIKRRLMVHGFGPDLIARATGMLSSEKTGEEAPPGCQKRSKSEPPRLGSQTSAAESRQASKAPTEASRQASKAPAEAPRQTSKAPTEASHGSKENAAAKMMADALANAIAFQQHQQDLQMLGSQSAVDCMYKLRKLQSRQERMERAAIKPPVPPQSVLRAGGHLLLCVVNDTAASADEQQLHGLGPNLGIGHFLKPLRNGEVAGKVQTGDQEPPVIVLAESLPGDWHSVVDCSRVYFRRGSALTLEDLETVSFRRARAIVIVRGHTGSCNGAQRSADAHMILATHMIESHLPSDSQIPIITDHAYNGTCEFLPLGVLSSVDIAGLRIGGPPMPLAPARDNSGTGLSLLGEKVAWDELGTAAQLHDEGYEELDSCDYAQHPRWMRGDMFVTGALTSLVANTLYNASLVPMVHAMIESSMLLLPLPIEWVRRSYAEFSFWLLSERNILALGIYRSSTAVKENTDGERLNVTGPTMYYMFTAPPGHDTRMTRSDRILCVAPSGPPPAAPA